MHAAVLALPWDKLSQARSSPRPVQLQWHVQRGEPGASPVAAAAKAEVKVAALAPRLGLATDERPAALSTGDVWDAYVPRPMLSLAPQPSEPVMLEWPAFDGERERYAGVLALFIDEQGRVQRVSVEGDELPAVLAEAARHAFAGLNFRPGELDGQPVKSLIHVEVSFEQAERPHPAARGLQP